MLISHDTTVIHIRRSTDLDARTHVHYAYPRLSALSPSQVHYMKCDLTHSWDMPEKHLCPDWRKRRSRALNFALFIKDGADS